MQNREAGSCLGCLRDSKVWYRVLQRERQPVRAMQGCQALDYCRDDKTLWRALSTGLTCFK